MLLVSAGDLRGAQAQLQPLLADVELTHPALAARVCLLALDLACATRSRELSEGETNMQACSAVCTKGQVLIGCARVQRPSACCRASCCHRHLPA